MPVAPAASPSSRPAAHAGAPAPGEAAPGQVATPRSLRNAPATRAAPSGAAASARLDRAVRPRPPPPRAPARPPAPSAPPPGYAPPPKAGGEWAFLDDRGLSVEDKLFRFMKLAAQKSDKELVDRMKEYRARFTDGAKSSSSGATARKGGLSLFDVAKSVVPALGLAEKVVGAAGLQKAAGAMGGPVLAGLATAAGLPQLAPVALRYGGELAQLAFKDVGGGSAGGPAGAKAEAGSPDERIAMLELQRLVEKQQQMFTAISNVLRSLHDTQMAAIHNIR